MSCVSSVGGAEGTSGGGGGVRGRNARIDEKKRKKKKGAGSRVFRATIGSHHKELVVAPPLGAHPEVLIHAEPRNEL